MTEKGRPPKKRGAKGGIKHQPGRGHKRKSQPQTQKRFRKKAKKLRKMLDEEARRAWAAWDALTDELKRLLGPDYEPRMPRPRNED